MPQAESAFQFLQYSEVLVSGCLVIKLRKMYADRLTWRPADDARDD